MRDVSAAFLSAARGSNNPVVTCDIWLGGEIVRSGIKIAGGFVEYDSTRDFEGRLSVTLVDYEEGGSRLADVIHAIGMQANIKAGFDMAGTIETVSMGWFDIYDTEAVDSWKWFDWTEEALKTESVVHVQGLDLMSIVAKSPLIEAMQPPAGADAWGTIEELCLGIVQVNDPGYAARTIPSDLVIDWERLAPIKQIASVWGAKPTMTGTGQLTLATAGSGDVIDDFGVKINISKWKSKTNSMDLRNGVRYIGRSPGGFDLIGIAKETDGLARWGGDFGYRPKREGPNPLMDTQSKVDAAAKTSLANEIASRAVTQTCDALWHPGIELRDKPTLILPDRPVPSKILGYRLPLSKGAMSVTLQLPVTL